MIVSDWLGGTGTGMLWNHSALFSCSLSSLLPLHTIFWPRRTWHIRELDEGSWTCCWGGICCGLLYRVFFVPYIKQGGPEKRLQLQALQGARSEKVAVKSIILHGFMVKVLYATNTASQLIAILNWTISIAVWKFSSVEMLVSLNKLNIPFIRIPRALLYK